MPGSKRIGFIIRDARLAKGMTQEELADKLGVTQSTISEVECGIRGLGLDLLDALKYILNLDITIVDIDAEKLDASG